ncbi:MAG: hypothetical protein DRN99_05380 [Thermoproteota archaeon]|nr:MAG: hypothetical protein DRN99_05380 [Candidatus Korarchaeota archaeon]
MQPGMLRHRLLEPKAVFIAGNIIYLALAAAGVASGVYNPPFSPSPQAVRLAAIAAVAGALSFTLAAEAGARLAPRDLRPLSLPAALAFTAILAKAAAQAGASPMLLAAAAPCLLIPFWKLEEVDSLASIAAGVALMLLGFKEAGGIPVLDARAASLYNASFTRAFSYTLLAFGCALWAALEGSSVRRVAPALLSAALLALTGSRADQAGVLASAAASAWLSRGIGALGLVLMAVACITPLAVLEVPGWLGSYAGLKYLLYRPSTTIYSLLKLAEHAGEGAGRALFTLRGRAVVAEYVGAEAGRSIASTWFGPPLLDYGLPGVLLVLGFTGFTLGLGYGRLLRERSELRRRLLASTYSLALAQLAICLDFGPDLAVIAGYMLLAYICTAARYEPGLTPRLRKLLTR